MSLSCHIFSHEKKKIGTSITKRGRERERERARERARQGGRERPAERDGERASVRERKNTEGGGEEGH